jgi:hypothetical protein
VRFDGKKLKNDSDMRRYRDNFKLKDSVPRKRRIIFGEVPNIARWVALPVAHSFERYKRLVLA